MRINDPYEYWQINKATRKAGDEAEKRLASVFARIADIREHNQLRVLQAMQEARVSDSGFGGTTGYGYDDMGRDQLEDVYARVFGAEAAYVRHSIATGTQALAACLYGILRPGDEMLSITGRPYDTLSRTIGLKALKKELSDPGSLKDFGITYRQVDLQPDGMPNWDEVAHSVRPETKLVFIQRSRGYMGRPAYRIEEIARLIELVRVQSSSVVIMVDNCYGEFVEKLEPCMVGADICAGSLIKNPGGGIAPGGGYIVGRADLVERAANRLTAPGLGSDVGPSLGMNRLLMQGFFLAPHVVAEALKGMAFAAELLAAHGVITSPAADTRRSDIVQTLKFPTAEAMIKFCQNVQRAAPVDSFVTPIPAPMPGYESDVIMAAGAFIQGGSLELSADGPIRPPYMAFMQGGIVYEQVKLAVLMAVQDMAATEDISEPTMKGL